MILHQLAGYGSVTPDTAPPAVSTRREFLKVAAGLIATSYIVTHPADGPSRTFGIAYTVGSDASFHELGYGMGEFGHQLYGY